MSNPNDPRLWWSQIRGTNGEIIRVTVMSSNAIEALEVMRSMYGTQLIIEQANPVVKASEPKLN